MAESAQLTQRIDRVLPVPVRAICQRLSRAGYQACTVGGAVRDALLGRAPGDWDVATSATPEQVIALFEKTIPTGIQHGTVTVLAGRGRGRMSVEVTTFRSEGTYSDSRRPDQVTFGVSLADDLGRRDFVINAVAYDPAAGVLIDPYGGRDDIQKQLVRAVGDARERFAEDGLRVMRAVRFAAVLGFTVDAATEAAIPGALSSLAKVSQERVRDELMKMLAAPQPSRGLQIARRTGIVQLILPEVASGLGIDAPLSPGFMDEQDRVATWHRTLTRVDAADGDEFVRLAALLWSARASKGIDALLRRLKLSNAMCGRVAKLVGHGPGWRAVAGDDAALRRVLGQVGRDNIDDLVALWAAEGTACAEDTATLDDVCARARAVVRAGDPLTIADLALSGTEVMDILQIRPSRVVGRLLQALLVRVYQDPTRNTREALAALVPEVYASLGGDSA